MERPDEKAATPSRFDPKTRSGRAAWAALIFIDALVFNLIYFLLLRSILLAPVGLSGSFAILFWGLAFVAALAGSHTLRYGRPTARAALLGAELAFFLIIAVAFAVLAGTTVAHKGSDWSWMRVEMIKIPHWLAMHARLSPVFTAAFFAVLAGLAALRVFATRPRWTRWTPLLAFAIYAVLVVRGMSVYLHEVSGQPGALRALDFYFGYILLFCAPGAAYVGLSLARRRIWAGRLIPLVLHMSLLSLNYLGVLPLHVHRGPLADADVPALADRVGVRRLYPPPGAEPDGSFAFLRKIVLTPDTLFVNYGPTCGMYAIDRRTGGGRWIYLRGLMRETRLSGDGRHVFGLNWQYGDFVAISVDPFERACRSDLFNAGIATPWGMDGDGDRLFVSNVTFPLVAELRLRPENGPCAVYLERTFDFHARGFTPFTDGAYDVFLDKERNRLYVALAMLDAEGGVGLMELDLDRWEVARQVKTRSGPVIVPVPERRAVLMPAYWGDAVYEISLDTMSVTRTIQAAPNVMSIVRDARRNRLYALSRAGGLMLVIDDDSGGALAALDAGAKPYALALDERTDQLYVGSAEGIFEIDLNRFTW